MARTCMLDLSFSGHLSLGLWLWWCLVVERCQRELKWHNCITAIAPKSIFMRIEMITYLPSLSSACITRVNSYVCVVSRRHCLIVYAKLQSGIWKLKDQEYSRRRQQQDRVQSRGSRSLPQVVGWKRGGNQTKSFNFKNIEKGRQNIPYLLFSWRRSGGSRSQTK